MKRQILKIIKIILIFSFFNSIQCIIADNNNDYEEEMEENTSIAGDRPSENEEFPNTNDNEENNNRINSKINRISDNVKKVSLALGIAGASAWVVSKGLKKLHSVKENKSIEKKDIANEKENSVISAAIINTPVKILTQQQKNNLESFDSIVESIPKVSLQNLAKAYSIQYLFNDLFLLLQLLDMEGKGTYNYINTFKINNNLKKIFNNNNLINPINPELSILNYKYYTGDYKFEFNNHNPKIILKNQYNMLFLLQTKEKNSPIQTKLINIFRHSDLKNLVDYNPLSSVEEQQFIENYNIPTNINSVFFNDTTKKEFLQVYYNSLQLQSEEKQKSVEDFLQNDYSINKIDNNRIFEEYNEFVEGILNNLTGDLSNLIGDKEINKLNEEFNKTDISFVHKTRKDFFNRIRSNFMDIIKFYIYKIINWDNNAGKYNDYKFIEDKVLTNAILTPNEKIIYNNQKIKQFIKSMKKFSDNLANSDTYSYTVLNSFLEIQENTHFIVHNNLIKEKDTNEYTLLEYQDFLKSVLKLFTKKNQP